MRTYCAVLVSIWMLGCSQAFANGSQWQIKVTDQHTYLTVVVTDFKGVNGTMTGLFNVEADPGKGCIHGVELALLHGDGYGNPLGKVSPPKTTPLYLEVDGRVLPVGDTYWIKYDNGFSALAAVGDEVVDAVRGGTEAIVQMTPGTPKFAFTISGADQAIGTIDNDCRAAMQGGG